MFEDNWSHGLCVCVCVRGLEGGMGDRDVKEKRWPASREDEQTGGGAEWRDKTMSDEWELKIGSILISLIKWFGVK